MGMVTDGKMAPGSVHFDHPYDCAQLRLRLQTARAACLALVSSVSNHRRTLIVSAFPLISLALDFLLRNFVGKWRYFWRGETDGFDISRVNDKRLRSETVSSTYEMGRYTARGTISS